METKKRIDRSEKLKSRKTLQETVVKCSLRQCLHGDNKDKVIDAINKRMEICSQRTYWASVALNLLIREIVSDVDDLTPIEFPEFWDPTFIRQLMLGTQDAQKKIINIKDLYTKYPELLSNSERHLGDRNIYSSAAIKFATNVKNHLRMNLDRVIKTYVYKVSGFNKEEGRNVLIDFFKYKNVTKTELSLDRQLEVEKCVCKLQNTLGLGKESRISKMWMKRDENLPWMLKIFITVNRSLETLNKPLITLHQVNYVTVNCNPKRSLFRKCIRGESLRKIPLRLRR